RPGLRPGRTCTSRSGWAAGASTGPVTRSTLCRIFWPGAAEPVRAPALVEAERWVLVAHEQHVRRDPGRPAVAAHHQVEDAARIAGGEEQDDCRDEEKYPGEAHARAPARLVSSRPRAPA